MNKGEILFKDVVRMYNKLKVYTLERPHGLICSENTKDSLKKYYEDIYGLKITTIKYFPDDRIWFLNKLDYENIAKNGLALLIEKIARVGELREYK